MKSFQSSFKLSMLLIGLLVGLLWGSSPGADIRKPNVIIFFTDDQGTLDVNCYGSKDI